MQNALDDFLKKFNPALNSYINKKITESKDINSISEVVLKEVERLILAGGKRIRPAIAYYSYLLNSKNKKQQKAVIEIGIGLELLHSFALIHDDIIDQADTRRNQPTSEKYFSNYFKNKHLGTSASILAGDFAHVLADEVFSNIDCESYQTRRKIQHFYYKMQFELIAGQTDDTLGTGQADISKLTEENILKMLKTKSGNYSIQSPLVLGAILAKADKQKIEILKIVGEKLGIVFQLIDDILGLYAKEEKTGKSTVNDILEGKRTLLIQKTYKKASIEERKIINQTLGNKNATKKQILIIKNLIKAKGVKKEVEELCKNLIHDSKTLLEKTYTNSPYLDFFLELSDYLLKRKS